MLLSSSSFILNDDLVGLNDSSSIANKALENSKSNNDAAFVQDFHLNLRLIRPDVKDYPEQQKEKDKGNVTRFNPDYYLKYSWLEYSITKNAAFFFVFRFFGDKNSKKDETFTKTGLRISAKHPIVLKVILNVQPTKQPIKCILIV